MVKLGVERARRLGHSNFGPAHLLYELVSEDTGRAAGVFQSLGLSLEGMRALL